MSMPLAAPTGTRPMADIAEIPALPRIMVAPNGARRTKADHPRLPMSDEELVETAIACRDAGAGGIHLHLRDEAGRHVLDAARYRALLAALAEAVPGMFLQITTEAVGRYSPEEQIAVLRATHPPAASVALGEILPAGADPGPARDLYHWAREEGIALQHILYAPAELDRLLRLLYEGVLPEPGPQNMLQVLFVLGRHSEGQRSRPADLDPFLARLPQDRPLDWAVCAFGPEETACLTYGAFRGGKVRVGFENSLWNADGSLSRDNAERVREIAERMARLETTRNRRAQGRSENRMGAAPGTDGVS